MPSLTFALTPHDPTRPTGIRRIYIQNLTDLLHACLLRGDVQRAKRAWAILIRCREVDWRSRWHWGLLLLSAEAESPAGDHTAVTSTQASTYYSQAEYQGRDVERWLKTLRISAKEEDKPSLLHALVLHLIKHERYRQALEELDTYLPSYPFLLSASLHTYAGLLAFYLAQPTSARGPTSTDTLPRASPSVDRDASHSPPLIAMYSYSEPADPALLRQARGWFAKALEIDETDPVSQEFIRLIDNPFAKNEDAESETTKDEDADGDEDEDQSMASRSEDDDDSQSEGGAGLDEKYDEAGIEEVSAAESGDDKSERFDFSLSEDGSS